MGKGYIQDKKPNVLCFSEFAIKRRPKTNFDKIANEHFQNILKKVEELHFVVIDSYCRGQIMLAVHRRMKYKTLDSFYSLPDLPKYPPGQKRQIKMRGQWVDFEMEGQTTRLITVHLISGNANDDAKSNQRRMELDYALTKAAENSSAIVTGDC